MVLLCTIDGTVIDVNIYGAPLPIQCKSCSNSGCVGCYDIIKQKRIWKQIRVPSSQLTSAKQSQHVVGGPSNAPTLANSNVNWNQSSDRANASIQSLYRPTVGNSTKTSITRERPGSQSPGGKGVDVKHNSYDRYLARKKAPVIRTETCESNAIKGNKTKSYGMINCL
jgi:hypothetical protein